MHDGNINTQNVTMLVFFESSFLNQFYCDIIVLVLGGKHNNLIYVYIVKWPPQ